MLLKSPVSPAAAAAIAQPAAATIAQPAPLSPKVEGMTVRATHDFEKHSEGVLSFKAGDEFTSGQLL